MWGVGRVKNIVKFLLGFLLGLWLGNLLGWSGSGYRAKISFSFKFRDMSYVWFTGGSLDQLCRQRYWPRNGLSFKLPVWFRMMVNR